MKNQPVPPHISCLTDYREHAKRLFSEQVWAYIDGASADALTHQLNRRAFDQLQLKSRILSGVKHCDTSITLLGESLPHPILLAPVAHQKLAHPMGELATSQAAAAQDTTMLVSTLANATLQDIAENSSNSRLWFQLYVQHDLGFTVELIRRAERAGYKALVITVDAPINGLRNAEQRVGFQLPPSLTAVNLSDLMAVERQSERNQFEQLLQQAPSWQTIEWLKNQTKLPIILKGVMCSEDAKLAMSYGVDGLIVSNHGGRTLDTQPATIHVLSSIQDVVSGQLAVLLDGGVRRGTDILKARALGADAVLIGRPIMYALATAGAMGVAHSIRLLRDELQLAMALCGFEQFENIDKGCLWNL